MRRRRDCLSPSLQARARRHHVETQGSPYRSGRLFRLVKMKNLACAAVKQETEEDWGRVSQAGAGIYLGANVMAASSRIAASVARPLSVSV